MEEEDAIDVALMMLNSEYEDPDLCDLPSVKEDGDMMRTMLKSYILLVAENITDFEAMLQHFKENDKVKKRPIRRMHFHYSGYAVYNEDDEKAQIGHCLIGSSGNLMSDPDLKKRLLGWNPEKLTITYDCNRSSSPTQFKITSSGLKTKDMQKMFTLCSTSKMTCTTFQKNSLTKELFKVTDGGEKPLQVEELDAAVNSSWQNRGLQDQTCHGEKVPDLWTGFTWPTPMSKENVAVLFFNAKYKHNSPKNNLEYVKTDEACMRTMLEGHNYELHVINDAEDIKATLQNIEEDIKAKDKKIGRLHFHFSGHGTRHNNPSHSVDAETKLGDFCLIGTGIDLKYYPGYLLKSKLLFWNPEKLTITLDCCRGEDDLTRCFQMTPEEHIETNERAILTTNKEKLASSCSELKKVCILYGTVDRHKAWDRRSFTQELYEVTKKGTKSIAIKDICKEVNKSWSKLKEGKSSSQLCISEMYDDGENWDGYMWPTGFSKDEDDKGLSLTKLDEVLSKIDSVRNKVLRTQAQVGSVERGVGSVRKAQQNMTEEQGNIKQDVNVLREDQVSMRGEIETIKKKKGKSKGFMSIFKRKSERSKTKTNRLSTSDPNISEHRQKLKRNQRKLSH